MSAEPGWYPVEGDPPGTLRRWNGVEWIGFPIAAPTEEQALVQGDVEVAPPSEPVARHTRTSGQVPLGLLAWFVRIPLGFLGLVLMLAGIALVAISFTPNAATAFDELEGSRAATESIERIEAPEGAVSDSTASSVFAGLVLGAVFVLLATGPLFVIWFTLAYRNLGLWHNRKRSTVWGVLAWIVPFISMIRPMTMMLELVENSPRRDRRGELSPTPVIAWWFMWNLPSWFLFFIALNTASSAAGTATAGLVAATGVALMVNGLAAFTGVYLVTKISSSQDSRRVA